jgi:hypothetical protein
MGGSGPAVEDQPGSVGDDLGGVLVGELEVEVVAGRAVGQIDQLDGVPSMGVVARPR